MEGRAVSPVRHAGTPDVVSAPAVAPAVPIAVAPGPLAATPAPAEVPGPPALELARPPCGDTRRFTSYLRCARCITFAMKVLFPLV